MTPRWVQPISKLSYAYFLIHFFILSYDVGTARTAFTFTFFNFVIIYIFNLLSTIFLFNIKLIISIFILFFRSDIV